MPLIEKWLDRSSKQFTPIQASIELTNRCNLRCTHCYIPKYEDDPSQILSLQEWYRIIDQLRAAGTLYVTFLGGEALLNKLFFKVCHYASKRGMSTSLITNGHLIKARQIEKFVDCGLKLATFSLYSRSPQIHDLMTAEQGAWKKTMAAIQLCRDSEIKVALNCLLTSQNIDTYDELATWCQSEQIPIQFDPSVTAKYDRNTQTTLLRPSKGQLQKFYKTRKQAAFPISNEEHICNAAKGKCAINAYGDLLSCMEIRKPLGNLIRDDFTKIWHSPEANRWRHLKNDTIKITGESDCASACDHCPGMSLNELGDPMAISDYQRELNSIKYQPPLQKGL